MPHLSFESPLGMVTVRGDAESVTEIFWGGTRGGLETAMLCAARDEILAYLIGNACEFSFPYTLRGTPFQRRAWQEIARVPYGETATYGGLAAVLDSGPRAVAGACARNRLPIVIPCHRVVAAGGQIGGYSGGNGLDTKRDLLRLEGSLGRVR